MLKSKHKTGSVIWGAGLFVAPTNGRLCFFLANFIKTLFLQPMRILLAGWMDV